MKRIHRYYADTEIVELGVYVECPHCGKEWLENDKTECGKTYVINCGDHGLDDGCGEYFEMYFDAD